MMDGTVTSSEALTHARARVRSIMSSGVGFYIGITEQPARRWAEHQERSSQWAEMRILFQAPSSSLTAYLEMSLLSEFGTNFLCVNCSIWREAVLRKSSLSVRAGVSPFSVAASACSSTAARRVSGAAWR